MALPAVVSIFYCSRYRILLRRLRPSNTSSVQEAAAVQIREVAMKTIDRALLPKIVSNAE